MYFSFSQEEINQEQLTHQMAGNPSAGALVTFVGQVRNQNNDRIVKFLEYEACPELGIAEANKIIDQVKEQFGIFNARAVHRIGALKVGDIAVWIAVNSAHRAEAFKACSYIIDEIKYRLPIWKKETYIDGSSEWINCSEDHLFCKIKLSEPQYYEKQLLLPEFTFSGQKKLKESKILVIGAGGLGSPALFYLACAGIGTIGICEFDLVEPSNLHRQILYGVNAVGSSKSEFARLRLIDLNPFITVISHNEMLTVDNAPRLFHDYDLVLDCTDNLNSKILINNLAINMQKPIIQASVYQYEGQIHRWLPTGNNSSSIGEGQCLSCLWDEGSILTQAKPCTESGVLGAVAGTIGTLQATEAIKYLVDLPSPLANNIVLFDLITLESRMLKIFRRADCKICSGTNYKTEEISSFSSDCLAKERVTSL